MGGDFCAWGEEADEVNQSEGGGEGEEGSEGPPPPGVGVGALAGDEEVDGGEEEEEERGLNFPFRFLIYGEKGDIPTFENK